MPLYENVFLVRPDVSAQQVEALAQAFSDAITENGGNVTKIEHWGLRNLTYRVKKSRKAHYVLFNIDAPATAVQTLEKSMRISEDVLRSLTVRVDELEEAPSAMMRNKGRDDRPRRNRHAGADGERNTPETAPAEAAVEVEIEKAAGQDTAEPAAAGIAMVEKGETKNGSADTSGEDTGK